MDISSKPPYIQNLHRAIADDANKPPVKSQLERKGNGISLFKSIHERAIKGCGITGSVADSLRFLSTLESRQLLTSAESLPLSRAVLKQECVISPEQCKFPLSINLLRWLSGYLRIMERSPSVKQGVEKIINDAPVDSVSELVLPEYNQDKLYDELISVKAQCDKFASEDQSSRVMTEKTRRLHLKELLLPLKDILNHNPITSQYMAICLDKSICTAECSFEHLYKHLKKMIKALHEAITYLSCMHERIDRLDINKVLVVKKEFCEFVKLIAFQRLPDENIPCLDDLEINELFYTKVLWDSSYAEFIKYITVNRIFCKKQDIPLALAVKNLENMFVNYMGAHLELDFEYETQGNLMGFIGSERYSALGSRFNRDNQYIGNVFFYRAVEYCYEVFQEWFRSHKIDSFNFEAEKFFHQLWHLDYSKLDDTQWLVSVIARSGLKPVGGPRGLHHRPAFMCLACGFSENVKKVEKSGLNDMPETIRQFASELIQLLQHHRERDCHLARSIDPQRLWNEKYKGKLPSSYV
ncbi:hypothetical protein [Endozoicomonas sp. ONNA2]|uniref:hypothetical protein n=1 Tax=Endozoicomonas sp. ONNA2 TaxID=2828741 RepID=UPI0021482A90|nr:hypothetical protein [Endozoicomonas sp. ONNA2]